MSNRELPVEIVEGEIALIIEYDPDATQVVHLLQAAIGFVESIDQLDHSLLSSIDSYLEPVSILNDVQHSSLKILLKRALKKIPDDTVRSMDWKKWVGELLVKGKHWILSNIDNDEVIDQQVNALAEHYAKPPNQLIGYDTPDLKKVHKAVRKVRNARARLSNRVAVQTEYGDIDIPRMPVESETTIETISENVLTDVYLKIDSVVFKDGKNKWRFHDGEIAFSALIEDSIFLERINQGERFGKGDKLLVDLSVKQSTIEDAMKSERVIVRVKDHVEAFKQGKLPI